MNKMNTLDKMDVLGHDALIDDCVSQRMLSLFFMYADSIYSRIFVSKHSLRKRPFFASVAFEHPMHNVYSYFLHSSAVTTHCKYEILNIASHQHTNINFLLLQIGAYIHKPHQIYV